MEASAFNVNARSQQKVCFYPDMHRRHFVDDLMLFASESSQMALDGYSDELVVSCLCLSDIETMLA